MHIVLFLAMCAPLGDRAATRVRLLTYGAVRLEIVDPSMTKRAHTSLSADWLRPDGHEMTPPDWQSEHMRCALACYWRCCAEAWQWCHDA